jgi:hypothetical protein
MLCRKTAGVVLLCALPLLAATAPGETIRFEYQFEAPRSELVKIDGAVYERLVMVGAPSDGRVGCPALPARGAKLLLPFASAVTSVQVIPGARVELGFGHNIIPVAQPVPLSSSTPPPPPQPDPTIYAQGQPFPGAPFELVTTQQFRGYGILVLRLQPVEYVPATGALAYYQSLTILVETAPAAAAPELYRGLPADRELVAGKVDNRAMLASYPAPARARPSFEYLIITTPALAGAYEPLKAWHDAHGTPTQIRTTTEIGGTNAELLRQYVKDRYLQDGISFLLIGADDDAIPAKDLYVDSGYYVENQMPTDMYFGCLDGTYNFDNDARWGEPTDGDGGGEVDLVAEVFVGRSCADTTAEVTRFINKTVWYLENQHAHPEKVLLVGEYLGFGGVGDYGGNYMDELVDGSSAHGYTTVGFPSELVVVSKLYDRDWPGHDWPKSELINRINASVHIVNHLGHGDVEYAMKLYNSDIPQLVNNDLCFMYSQTCLAGHLDGAECFAETAHIKTDHAAFAVIMNARYGWGEFESTDGPSQRFNREFWDCIYNPDEGRFSLGEANADSKEDNIYRMNQECMRWCCYELNLFGDPTINLPGSCTDAGTVELDAAKVACEDSVVVTVRDCGLNVNPGALDTVTIVLSSTSEPSGEPLVLTETNLKSSRFEGALSVSDTDAPGVLQVSPGDTVTATYIDADDGAGGINVAVTDSASVDCAPPAFTGVQVTDIEPRAATVTFLANEPVRGIVHYGLSCSSLNQTAYGAGLALGAQVRLTGLTDNTTYYFSVSAQDEAGNVTDDPTCYSFNTPEVPDFFTELFASGNDLDHLSVIFTPNGSVDFYDGCVEAITALPTNPTGGAPLGLSDDNALTVILTGGATVSLYGVSYPRLYVGSNGFITFGTGDGTNAESLENHFNQPRISGLFDDLDPPTGSVTWKQLADRVAVTWLNVPKWNTTLYNTFQIEMFFDGTIKLNYLEIGIDDGLAGLSAGGGVNPDFYMSDLSAMGVCVPTPPTANNADYGTTLGAAVTLNLTADDDGLPDPPGILDYVITGLPAHGTLAVTGGAAITAVPYVLPNHGKGVTYTPGAFFLGSDSFQFVANDGGVPPEGGDSNIATVTINVTTVPQVVHSWTLDSNPGWAVEGQWAFGQPMGGGSHARDPLSGHTGSNVYGYNLAGDYGNNMLCRCLTTTAIDLSRSGNTVLKFWRWLGVEGGGFDHAGVQVSADGVNWFSIWEHTGAAINEAAWSQKSYDISAIADHQSTVFVRWTMGTTDGGVTYPGWNIDDVEIWGMVPPQPETGDLNCDGSVGFADINPFVLVLTNPAAYAAAFPGCDPLLADINGDGSVGFDDINPFVTLLTAP